MELFDTAPKRTNEGHDECYCVIYEIQIELFVLSSIHNIMDKNQMPFHTKDIIFYGLEMEICNHKLDEKKRTKMD